MGIIVAVTPRIDSTIVMKRNTKVSSEELVKLASIEQVILPQLKPEVVFLDLNLSSSNRKNQTDNIWASSWFLNAKQLLYSGYMQMVPSSENLKWKRSVPSYKGTSYHIWNINGADAVETIRNRKV